MDITTRRKIISSILLAVFLSIQALTILHIHSDVETVNVCHDCVAHVHHNGHLSSASFSIDNCLICQFLSLPFAATAGLQIIVFVHTETSTFIRFIAPLYDTASQFVLLRAPPVIG